MEFTNESNLIALSGLPQGYTAADHARDQDLFGAWLKENYPECQFVGPCTVGDIDMFDMGNDGVFFHNTLASSDYGFLKHGSFDPHPNYFAVKLWNQLMGSTVYTSGIQLKEGKHVYCHSRKDGKDGCVYLVINNSWIETTTEQ